MYERVIHFRVDLGNEDRICDGEVLREYTDHLQHNIIIMFSCTAGEPLIFVFDIIATFIVTSIVIIW